MGQYRSSYVAHTYGLVYIQWVKGIICIKKKRHGAHYWCTQVLMECGKIPQVPSQVLGALAKRGCQSSVASRTSNLALEMSQWKFQGLPLSHRACPKQTLKGLKRLWQKWKLTIAPNQKKTVNTTRPLSLGKSIPIFIKQSMCPIMWFICVCSMCSMQKMDHNSWITIHGDHYSTFFERNPSAK